MLNDLLMSVPVSGDSRDNIRRAWDVATGDEAFKIMYQLVHVVGQYRANSTEPGDYIATNQN